MWDPYGAPGDWPPWTVGLARHRVHVYGDALLGSREAVHGRLNRQTSLRSHGVLTSERPWFKCACRGKVVSKLAHHSGGNFRVA